MKNLIKFATAAVLLSGLLLSNAALDVYASTHTLQFVETPTETLYQGISGTQTTMTITPVPEDLDGNVLTIASFGSSPTLTIDPGVTGLEEIVSFTSMVNNGNNTETLSGLTRDLNSQYPYTGTNSVYVAHGAGAVVVFSNNPQMYNRLAAPENDELITGSWTYSASNLPGYNSQPSSYGSLNFVDYSTLLSTAIQGAGTSTEKTLGVVQLATFGQVGTGVASSTSGAPYVIENKFASSTYNGSTVFQGEIPALNSNFRIDPNFIATSTGNNYNFAGNITLSTTTAYTENTGTLTATTTTNFPASAKWNGISYTLPSSQGAANSVWTNNGSGGISWSAPVIPHYSLVNSNNISATAASSPNYATSTLILGIPAGTLTGSSTINVTANIQCTSSSSDCIYLLRDNGGTTFATCDLGNNGQSNNLGTLIISASNQSSLSSQSALVNGWTNAAGTTNSLHMCQTVSTSSFNTANALNLVMVAEATEGSEATVINGYSITVNP